MIRLALFEPDIAPNVGAFIRLAACMGAELNIIEPCGFVWDEKKIRRAALDYFDHATIRRHRSFSHFETARKETGSRLILLTTKADLTYVNFCFHPNDTLLLGRESAGVTQEVADASDTHITIPMHGGARSLNVVLAATMVLGEALRQTNQLPNMKAMR